MHGKNKFHKKTFFKILEKKSYNVSYHYLPKFLLLNYLFFLDFKHIIYAVYLHLPSLTFKVPFNLN